MRPIITVDRLGKKYFLGPRESVPPTLREAVKNSVHSKLRPLSRRNGNGHPSLWALKDISFEIKPGEAVGVIGRNGAGKPTHLRILARITRPTTGTAELCGRCGSLPAGGTGLQPGTTGS